MTQSRTHYIPVSGITIEDITNVINDTLPGIIADILPPLIDDAVGDILNPDPALYCPINGYTPPEPSGEYIPPIDIPKPDPLVQSITLQCSKSLSNTIYLKAQGNYTVKVYTSTMYEIHSVNVNANATFTYTFTTDGYYIVIITPQAGANISTFQILSHAVYGYNQPIHFAILNTPELVTGLQMFHNLFSLKGIEIHSTLDKCTTLSRLVSNTSVEYFKFPSTLNLCQQLSYMFENTPIRTIDFNNCVCPELQTIEYMCQNTFQLQNLYINITAPKLYGYNYVANYSFAENIEFNMTVLNPSASGTMQYAVSNCSRLKQVKFPIFNHGGIVNYSLALNNCPQLIIVEFRGIHTTQISSMFNASTINISEIIINGEINLVSGLTLNIYAQKMYKIVIKNVVQGTLQAYGLCEDIIFEAIPNPGLYFNCTSIQLKSFVYPTFRCVSFWCGATGSAITDIDIDWANCNWISDSQTRILVRGNISAARLNQIYTALANVTGAPVRVEFKHCTGYAASDKTILTNKGYVLT